VELLPFVVIIAAFWFLLIRPQQKRARQAREMQNALGVGDKVLLASGIYGEVAGVTDDYVLVSIADGVEIRVVRNAIGQVLPPEASVGEADATQEPVVDDGTVDLSKPAAAPEQSEVDGASDPGAPETPEETLERLRKQGENQ